MCKDKADNESMRKRLATHWIFFKSTLPVGISGAFVMCLLGSMLPSAQSGVISLIVAFFSFLPGGILLDLLYKEVARKEEYYFYYNLSITRIELWGVTLLLSYFLYLFVKIIGSLCIPA